MPAFSELREIMRVSVEVEDSLSTGQTPSGEARVVPFVRGTFTGPALDLYGVLLPGGTDWQLVRPDGVLEIRAHYMLQTDRDEVIEVVSNGLRAASPEVLERIAAGEVVAPSEYYFRTAVRIRSGASRLAELNQRLFIGIGERTARNATVTIRQVP